MSKDHTEPGTPTIADCFFPDGGSESAGYDANHNLLVVRTIAGHAGCGSGDEIRKQRFTYDTRDLPTEIAQEVHAPGKAALSRTQSFTYRKDGSIKTSTWDGNTTTYDYSDGSLLEGVTDWRGSPETSSFDYFPAGNPQAVELGRRHHRSLRLPPRRGARVARMDRRGPRSGKEPQRPHL